MRYILPGTEIRMGAIALEQEFANMVPAAPEMDWAAAFDAVETLRDLDRLITAFDASTAQWRNDIRAKMRVGFDAVQAGMTALPEAEARRIVLPMVDEALTAVEGLRSAYEIPLHERPELSDKMARLSRLSGGAGRYLRKQFRRIEDIRVAQYNAAVDFYYGFLAFRSEIEEDREGVATFSDPAALGEFLRKQVA